MDSANDTGESIKADARTRKHTHCTCANPHVTSSSDFQRRHAVREERGEGEKSASQC